MPNASLREIFFNFAKYVLNDDINSLTDFPAYDLFHRYFEKEIEKYKIPQPALVSWLTPEERTKVIQDLAMNPVLDISLINEPAPMNGTSYPKVNLFHFRQQFQRAEDFGKIFDRTKSFDRTNSFGKRARTSDS